MTTWRAHVPNLLTLGRFPLALIAALGYARAQTLLTEARFAPDAGLIDATLEARAGVWLMLGAGAFALAALSDFLDGWLARRWSVQSQFGRALDPVADKVLIAAMAAAIFWGVRDAGWSALVVAGPGGVIVARDIGVSVLRARHGDGGGLAVTGLAKWKTATEMAAAGAAFGVLALSAGWPLGAQAQWAEGDWAFVALAGLAWIGLYWSAAILSAWTGWTYWRAAARKH